MKNTTRNTKLTALIAFALIVAAFAYMYVPTIAAQPGDAADPLVTRRFVEQSIAPLSEEIAELRAIIAAIDPAALPTQGTQQGNQQITGEGLSPAERDAFLSEIMQHVNTALANFGPGGVTGEVPIAPFRTITMQPGQSIIFEAGAEFIIRGGAATAIAPVPYNGIPDVTAGRDIPDGERLGQNHLFIIPRSDGRGAAFTERTWVMLRGGYTIIG